MTIKFNNVYVENVSTVAGPFVIEGPLKDNFDKKFTDFYDGEKTFEKCEMKELKECKADYKETLRLISKITNDNTIKDIVDDTLNGK